MLVSILANVRIWLCLKYFRNTVALLNVVFQFYLALDLMS